MMFAEQELLTLSRAARKLKVPVNWLRAEAEAGRVPCLKAGRQFLFDFNSLKAVLRERARISDPGNTAGDSNP